MEPREITPPPSSLPPSALSTSFFLSSCVLAFFLSSLFLAFSSSCSLELAFTRSARHVSVLPVSFSFSLFPLSFSLSHSIRFVLLDLNSKGSHKIWGFQVQAVLPSPRHAVSDSVHVWLFSNVRFSRNVCLFLLTVQKKSVFIWVMHTMPSRK